MTVRSEELHGLIRADEILTKPFNTRSPLLRLTALQYAWLTTGLEKSLKLVVYKKYLFTF